MSPASRSRITASWLRSCASSALTARARRLGGRELDPGERDGSVDRVEDRGKLRGDTRGDLALRAPHHRATRRLGGGFALALALAFELDDSGFTGADPLAERLDVQSGPHLRVPGGLERGEHALARRGIQDRPRRLERVHELVLGRARGCLCLVDGGGGLCHTGGEPLALGDGRLVADGGAVDLLGVRRERGIVLAQRRQGAPSCDGARYSSATRAIRESLAQRVGHDLHLGAALSRGIPLRREFEARSTLPRTGAHGVLGDDFAGAGHDRDGAATAAAASRGPAARAASRSSATTT